MGGWAYAAALVKADRLWGAAPRPKPESLVAGASAAPIAIRREVAVIVEAN
jgi:hypothetical protein